MEWATLDQNSLINGYRLERIRIYAIVTLFSLLHLALRGQISFVIDETVYQNSLNGWQDCANYVQIQQGIPADWDIEEVVKLQSGWQTLSDLPGFSWKENCWLKLTLTNEQSSLSELVLLLHADDFTLWYEQEGQILGKKVGGNLHPRSQWDSQQHSPVYSSPHTIQFELQEKTTRTIYLRLGVNDQRLVLQPKLCNRSFFLGHSTSYFNRTIATQSFLHGVLWIMLLYHFLFFMMNRNLAYGYYAFYILFLSIHLFYAFDLHYLTVLAEYPRVNRILLIGSVYAFIIGHTQFLKHFLHQNNWRNDLKKLLVNYVKGVSFIGLINLILLTLSPTNFRIVNSSWFLFLVAAIGLLGFIYLNRQYWKSDFRLARYVAINNFFLFYGLMVSTIIYYLGVLGWIDLLSSSFWGILFLELMLVLQILSFALSLSYQGLETERERTKLKELDQLKSRFFANISHEFRTPLTLILGPLKQLKAIINQPNTRRQIGTAENYAQRLLRMVNQILDLTKLESGKLQLQAQVFDIVSLTKSITYSFESIAKERGIHLAVNSVEDTWPIYLDKDKIEQILLNLIGNAMKYNKEGGAITVGLEMTKSKALRIKIRDTGIGISADSLPYIFQLYYQESQQVDTTNQAGSSGIGLALTKELIQLYKGTIHVESELGKGSCFTVEIPLPKFNREEIRIASTSIETPGNRPQRWIQKEVSLGQQKAMILLIEDHPDVQDYIRSCLVDNFQILLARNGQEGLTLARKEVPDLIITDVMMPKMDGFTLTQNLKEDQITSHIPIIMLTGKSSQESRLEGLRKQADEYLVKPFDPEELQLRVQNLLDNRQKWITHFKRQNNGLAEQISLPSMEARFLEKVKDLIQTNLENENYSVEQLGKDLQLDRTQLFRKLKAITGQNPSQFIRVYRLETAYQLLKNRTATVAEIAFQVGFSNPSYFNRTFKAHFKKTPGEVMKG